MKAHLLSGCPYLPLGSGARAPVCDTWWLPLHHRRRVPMVTRNCAGCPVSSREPGRQALPSQGCTLGRQSSALRLRISWELFGTPVPRP